MTRLTLRALAAAAVLALAALPSIAEASQTQGLQFPQMAQPTADLRVRVGPGSYFPEITTVQRGQYLSIRSCSGVWCQLTPMDGVPAGWVHSNYLIWRGAIQG